MPKPSTSADKIRQSYPDIWEHFTALAKTCHEAGPLDEKTRRLVKLALAIAAGTEGGTHSAVRHAKEMGITMQEMEHVVLLSITTLGFPAAGRAMAWVYDSAK
jgi:alkylhydroperoxidase/carboxymuconolactone decarboxylase family protein YurZ